MATKYEARGVAVVALTYRKLSELINSEARKVRSFLIDGEELDVSVIRHPTRINRYTIVTEFYLLNIAPSALLDRLRIDLLATGLFIPDYDFLVTIKEIKPQ